MNQNIWGPYAWTVIHTVFAIPHPKARVLSELTCDILPCSICVMHCSENKQKTLYEPNLALQWFKIHNFVNLRLGKPVWSESRFLATKYQVDANFFSSLRIFLLIIAEFFKTHPYSHNLDLWVRLLLEIIGAPPSMYNRFSANRPLVARINNMFGVDRVTEEEEKIVQSAIVVRKNNGFSSFFGKSFF